MKTKYILVICAALIVSACNKGEEMVQEETVKEYSVATELAEKREYIAEVNYSGTLFANKEANLGVSIPGRVEKIHIAEGDYVKKGDLIAELSSEMVTQAKLEYQTYKKDFERIEKLFKKGSVAEQKYDHVKSMFEAKAANYELVKKSSEIRAPFSGVVVEHMINEGENFVLNPGLKPGYSNTSGIVRLMQLNPLVAKIEVNEKDLAHVRNGQKVMLEFATAGDEKLAGRVSHIAAILSTVTRTATVEISVDNQGNKLKPGMYCQTAIVMPSDTMVFVPREAVMKQKGTGQYFVFTNDDGTAKQINIEVLAEEDEFFVINGIEEGEEVITAGKTKLVNGSKIRCNNGGKE